MYDKNVIVDQSVMDVRDKEGDFLNRQVSLCQETIKEDIRKFVGCVEMFEVMLDEDIEKDKRKEVGKVGYEPEKVIDSVKEMYKMKPSDRMTPEVEYKIALEKFKLLYRIFKDAHVPISRETNL